jgi:DNA-binding CsgD family transcriptional regulator
MSGWIDPSASLRSTMTTPWIGLMQRTAVSTAPNGSLVDLHTRLIDFTNAVGNFGNPKDVLDALHTVSTACVPLNVLGAARLPIKANNLASAQLGKSAFLHDGVPAGWWNEYATLAKSNFAPAIFLARSSLASFTWTETTKMLEPIGVDRWSVELGLKYGMRDGLTYAVGGRWVVGFWSPRELSRILTHPARVIICAAASLAALRLEQLSGPDANRIGSRPRLTPREVAVLRMVSMGRQSGDIARALGLGAETVRSHMKKAQAKLGAHNRTQAACQALCQNLIP